MTYPVTLSVSFPQFGRNYYAQDVILNSASPLIEDERFDLFLLPAATRHFSNGVVGFHDQFRFLSDILDEHLSETEPGEAAGYDYRPSQPAGR